MTKCDKCGNSYYGSNCTLTGGYIVNLCNNCRNRWYVYLIDNKLQEKYKLLAAEYDCLIQIGDVSRAKEVAKLLIAEARVLFDISEAWVKRIGD